MDHIAESSKPDNILKDWVNLYSKKMYTWALHKTSHKETAEDLVQETFLSAYQSFEKFKGDSSPQTWLFAILKNKINSFHRKNYRANNILKSNTEEDDLLNYIFDHHDNWKIDQKPGYWPEEDMNILDDMEFNTILQSCMAKLPANWFSAIQLKYLEEKNGSLICQELNISPTNFWQILHRSKLQLRKCLENNWFKK